MQRRLRVPFDDLEAFRREYEAHIARGGLFVPTLERFEPRELVEVELDLRFCDASPVFQAEVVRRLRPPGRSVPGIALQLLESTPQLRVRLEALTGIRAAEPDSASREGPARRHERREERVETQLRSGRSEHATYTLNLSSSGALLPAGDDPPPLGDLVRLSLVHPGTGERLEVDGRVVRHELRGGKVEQVAVEFASQLSQGIEAAFLETSLAAAHARSIGRVEGDLSAMNPAGLIQMLPSSANEGTLVIRAPQPGRIGCVLFRNGMLAYVSLGRLRGSKALCRLLAWQEGRFEYTPEILPVEEWEEAEPLPLPGALLEALQHHDELGNVDRSALQPEALLSRTTEVDGSQDKLEAQLLALLERPRRVAEVLDSIPEYDVVIYRALLALLESGAIALRAA
jgi:hypothetical protein